VTVFKAPETGAIDLLESMSSQIWPNFGDQAHLFGHRGVVRKAAKRGLPVLAALMLAMDL